MTNEIYKVFSPEELFEAARVQFVDLIAAYDESVLKHGYRQSLE